MCDSNFVRGVGWKGWRELPPQSASISSSEWIDLSHPWNEHMPRQAFFPVPRFDRFLSIPEHQLNVTKMEMVVHTGTHVDSPRHFYEDGPAFEDIPMDRLSGPGLVWSVKYGIDKEIQPEHLEGARARLKPGDILILNTGSYHLAGTPAYDDHPALSLAAAQWVVDQNIKLLAMDTPTPDTALRYRTESFVFPVHRLLLGHGVLIAEHLTNLDALNGRRVEVVCNALNISGADGAPARILARPLDDG